MGTFHHGKHELHGITVIVDTTGSKIYVGRCDDVDENGIVLLDADSHEEGQNGLSKADYVQNAARYGVWKRMERVAVRREEVSSIRRLGELL